MERVLPDNPFKGSLAAEYDLLRLMCPNSIKLAAMIGDKISHVFTDLKSVKGFEIGCGTGICTHYILTYHTTLNLTSVAISSHMLVQAKDLLEKELAAGRLNLIEKDALAQLKLAPSQSLDFVASNYAIHNFDISYRQEALNEILRILKPGGFFINGDRYAFDDSPHQLEDTQNLIREWFRLFKKIDRMDLLEDWIAHLMSDESPHILMRFNYSINQLKALGFIEVNVDFREGVDTLICAYKPAVA
ncbi:MAG: methyltransferase domain-containing protein [Methylocystis sp.]